MTDGWPHVSRPLGVLWLLTVYACGSPETVETVEKAAPPDPSTQARDDARVVLERHCGRCHLPSQPTALPSALAIFDLSEEEWAGRLEPDALAGVYERLRPADGMAMDPEAAPTTAEERAIVRDYLVRRFGPHDAPEWFAP